MRIDKQSGKYLRLVVSITFLHVLSYFVVGSLAYFLIYDAAIDAGGFDQFMRSPNVPEQWRHVETWVVPAEFLRGVLFGLALAPFFKALSALNLGTRFGVIYFLLLVLCIFNVTMPAVGSIEGWVYLLPAAGPELANPLLGYIEVPLQLALFSFLVAYRIGKILPHAEKVLHSNRERGDELV